MLAPSDSLRAACVLVAALFAGGSGASADALRGSGFAFPDALPDLGRSLEIVGTLNLATSDPPFDPQPVEYTWTIYGASVHSVEDPSSGIRTRYLTFGVLEIRSDPSFNSLYEANPPNELVPRTFHDGEVVLLGSVTEFAIREIYGIVTASGEVLFEGGSALPGVTGEWTLNAAVSVEAGGAIPPGYGSQWNLELAPTQPVRITPETWTSIKALYR
jgi:hypothetical protein